MTYAPDWDVDAADGAEAEELFRRLRVGILRGTTEVKRDRRVIETGNFYVELECRRADGWHDSGLRTTKARSWAFVAWPIVIAVPVWILRIAIEGAKSAECSRGSHPTRGVLVSAAELLPLLIKAATAPLTQEKQAA